MLLKQKTGLQGLLEMVAKSLSDSDIDLGGAVSQCYDGDSVMSGEKGGLQRLMCDKCGHEIIYVYCYCHKLHLIVDAILVSIEEVSDHFVFIKCIYECFKWPDVREHYNGAKLKRLPDQSYPGMS